MGSKRHVVAVGGKTIRKGTSLFQTHTEEVLWYTGFQDGQVTLEKLDESITMSEDAFRTQIIRGDIRIQAQPHGYID